MKALERQLNGLSSIPRNSALDEEKRLDKNALARAKRLATKHGMQIERDSQSGWWVMCPGVTDTPADPYSGDHCCTSGREVLDAVQIYADHLTSQKKSFIPYDDPPYIGAPVEQPPRKSPEPELIKQRRLECALTQSQCAEMVHLSHPVRWAEYERGAQAMDSARWELFLIKTGFHALYKPAKGVPVPRNE
jgi:hypothetical protein